MLSVKAGLGEFSSEAGARVDGRPTIRGSHFIGEPVLAKEAVDQELMHRLHGDVRKAMDEIRQTQATTLAALANLQAALIRWIIFTGLVLIIMLKLI